MSGRTIIVGDVHGCRKELEELLALVAFTEGDTLVFVGDLVARGPDSRGVLGAARRTRALAVRGNHEARLLAWRSNPDDVKLGRLHREVAESLADEEWRQLEAMPLHTTLAAHDVLVVHAGIEPGIPLEKQTPDTLVHIRTVADGTLWGEAYEGPPHVVFGHHALAGIQLHAWATGLDSGCVYGGSLTALVLAPGETIARSAKARRGQLRSVRAGQRYFVP